MKNNNEVEKLAPMLPQFYYTTTPKQHKKYNKG